jgi:hypothetical protein
VVPSASFCCSTHHRKSYASVCRWIDSVWVSFDICLGEGCKEWEQARSSFASHFEKESRSFWLTLQSWRSVACKGEPWMDQEGSNLLFRMNPASSLSHFASSACYLLKFKHVRKTWLLLRVNWDKADDLELLSADLSSRDSLILLPVLYDALPKSGSILAYGLPDMLFLAVSNDYKAFLDPLSNLVASTVVPATIPGKFRLIVGYCYPCDGWESFLPSCIIYILW